jgi:hypothetical protein
MFNDAAIKPEKIGEPNGSVIAHFRDQKKIKTGSASDNPAPMETSRIIRTIW